VKMRKFTASKRVLTVFVSALFTLFSVCGNWLAHADHSTPNKKQHALISTSNCATCPSAPGEGGPSKPVWQETLGARTQVAPLSPTVRSAGDGVPVNFVSTSTGNLAFAVTDLSLPGVMPIWFQRTYSSADSLDLGLGRGWSFAYDGRIAVNGDSATMTANSSTISFKREGNGSHFVLAVAEPIPHQSFDLVGESVISESVMGMTRTYQKAGATYRLATIADANGNTITVSFNSNGNISQIKNGSGAALNLQWSSGGASLLSVTDSQRRTVSFLHTGGLLSGFVDPAKGRWTHTYASGLLTGVTDPAGRALLRAAFDQDGRAIVSSNAAGTYNFSYSPGPSVGGDAVSQRTLVTDPMGATLSFEHNERGAIVGTDDGAGNSSKMEYDSAGRLAHLTDSAGGDRTFTYDGQNRLTRFSPNDGSGDLVPAYDQAGNLASESLGESRMDFSFDKKGNIVGLSGDVQHPYTAELNSAGQTVSLVSGDQTVKLEYDAAGNQTALTFGNTGRIQHAYDSAGRLVSTRLPSGQTETYTYDARGLLAKKANSEGGSITFERDATGALMKTVNAAGRWVKATRDQAGRITSLKRSNGKSRTYAYNAKGAVTDYVDAKGRHTVFQYDRAGRLVGSTMVSQTTRDRSRSVSTLVPSSRPIAPLSVSYSQGALSNGVNHHAHHRGDNVDPFGVGTTGTYNPQVEPCCGDDDDDDDDDDGDDDDDDDDDDCGDVAASGGYSTACTQSCAACKDAQNQICNLNLSSCQNTANAVAATAAALCLTAIALPPPAGEIIYAACAAAVLVSQHAALTNCQNSFDVCLLSIPANCPQCP
jgi:YD repeat-containing protein